MACFLSHGSLSQDNLVTRQHCRGGHDPQWQIVLGPGSCRMNHTFLRGILIWASLSLESLLLFKTFFQLKKVVCFFWGSHRVACGNLNSSIRDWAHTSCGGSTESEALDCQERPYFLIFYNLSYSNEVNLQCCVSFLYTAKWFSYIYICIFFIFFSIMAYYRILNTLCYTVGPWCLSILCTKFAFANPKLPINLSPTPSSLGTTNLFSMFESVFLCCR